MYKMTAYCLANGILAVKTQSKSKKAYEKEREQCISLWH